jgi:alkyldihydroxyacetonephosphate synthase
MEDNAGLNINHVTPAQEVCPIPPPTINEPFMKQIEGNYLQISTTDKERLFHGHGHTTQELFKLRWGSFARVPDVVIWPENHDQVVAIVKAAVAHNVVIIPYGGGTNVTQALLCPEGEARMIVSLDMHGMSRIKWVDRVSMTACIEAGILAHRFILLIGNCIGAVGKELEAKLASLDLCFANRTVWSSRH